VNWPAASKLNFMSVGVLLALLIIASAPNFGLKQALSAAVPSALLAFMGMWLIWKERVALFEIPAQRRWAVIALLLLIPIAISVPGSYKPGTSASIAVALVIYYFTGVTLIQVLRDPSRRAWLARWILVVLVFWMGDSLVQYFLGQDLFGIALTPEGRITGPFEGNLRQGMFLAMLIPIAIGVVLESGKGGTWAVLLFAAAASIGLLSGVRMVFVMLAIAVAGLLIHLPRSRWKWALLTILPLIAVLAISLSPVLQQRMSTLSGVEKLDFAAIDRFLSFRATIWETGLHMVERRPFNGVGAGAFDTAYRDFATRPGDVFANGPVRVYHAHQVYVAFAAETGLPGLTALVAIIILCARWYWRSSSGARQRAWTYALALTVYFFPLNTQPPLFNHWLFPILLLLLAAFLASLDEPQPGPPAAAGEGKNATQQV